MAIKNTVAIAMRDGIDIPVDNVIVSKTHVWSEPQYNEEGVYTGVQRYIAYDLLPYKDEASVTTYGVESIKGEMVDVPSGWTKQMTAQEYTDLLADGSLAEFWLKDQFNIWLSGNNASVVDPYPAP
jgi:hypothetical protein